MNKDVTKKYANDDITIVWQPGKCSHSTRCWNNETGLKSVFNPAKRPWIDPNAATTEEIITRINNCPSGALSYYKNSEQKQERETEVKTEQMVEVTENGPLLVFGNIIVKDKEGNETPKNKVTAFCRCGQSNNKPYCDGTHVKCGFKG